MSLAVVRDLVARDAPQAADGDTGALQLGLRRLCRTAARTLPADGATVSVVTHVGGLTFAAASGPVAQSLASLEFALGEGPGVDSVATRRPVLVPDLQIVPTGRWPVFVPAACALDVRAVFAFPLVVGAATLGALNVHRREPTALDVRATRLALAFVDLAVELLLDAGARVRQDVGAPDDGESGVRERDEVLDGHYIVYQAQGMTMVDLGIPLAEALIRLRAKAFSDGRSLHDVARDVVEGRLRLDPDSDGSGHRPAPRDDTREQR